MKTTLISITGILLTSSCLSHRATQKERDLFSMAKTTETLATNQWLHQLYTHDSNTIVWHFKTDAPFTYHPDTGLQAQQGDLWLSAQAVQWQYTVADSNYTKIETTESRQQHEEKTVRTERRPAGQNAWIWAVGIVMLIGVIYLIRL